MDVNGLLDLFDYRVGNYSRHAAHKDPIVVTQLMNEIPDVNYAITKKQIERIELSGRDLEQVFFIVSPRSYVEGQRVPEQVLPG